MKEESQLNKVFIGRQKSLIPFPVFIPDEARRSHTLVVGMTGSGKSTTLKSLIYQDLKAQKSVLIVDGKGDPDLISGFSSSFQRIVFSRNPDGNCYFNPLKGEVHEVVSNFFTACADKFQQSYYKEFARSLLTGYLEICKELQEEPSFIELARICHSLDTYKDIIISIKNPLIRAKFTPLFEMKVGEYKEKHSGLGAVVQNIVSSPWIKFLESSTELPELKVEDLGETPSCIYVGLQKLSNLDSAGVVGRLLLLKVGNLSAKRASGGSVSPTISVFVDELHGVAYQGLEALVQTARSSRIMLTLSTQTLSDLDSVSPNFTMQIMTNTAVKIIHQQNSHKDADSWAKHFGDISFKDKAGIGFLGGFFDFLATPPEASGGSIKGRLKEERVWYLEPNEFKNLKRGIAVIEINLPNSKKIQKCKVKALAIGGK
ncbi:MAG: type IV secretion system DNA-binding domain-containing protein [Parvularculaceae bacterium]